MFPRETANEKPRESHSLGFSIPFLYGGLNHRLVTGYLSPSNHLQMRWQTTPAMTVAIKDKMFSKAKHLLPVTRLEAVTLTL